MQKYFENFQCIEDVINAYEIDSSELAEVTILAAYYSYEDYSGKSMVVFRKEGKLYEVHGSHCSCNGLEGQWNPEETTEAALFDRMGNTKEYLVRDFGEEFVEALRYGLIDEVFEEKVLLSK